MANGSPPPPLLLLGKIPWSLTPALHKLPNGWSVLDRDGGGRGRVHEAHLVQHWFQIQACRVCNSVQICHQAVVQEGAVCCKTCMPAWITASIGVGTTCFCTFGLLNEEEEEEEEEDCILRKHHLHCAIITEMSTRAVSGTVLPSGQDAILMQMATLQGQSTGPKTFWQVFFKI